jgi:hypothetical protein
MAPHESAAMASKSTIDSNKNGGDAGVSDKTSAILSKLGKMKGSDGADAASKRGKFDVPGPKKPQ